ncbi:hypothetical protein [Roseovarius aestuariivivens]|uniref:hypothetical protein n=1 Tax=Roseovarius aestuariivivens TaxID=1888910 RepID=UPI001080E289|nr:hypothetical protein [Roseovarius aestuariivivens]
MELLVSLMAGALGGNLARGLRHDRLGFLLASALGVIGGGLCGLALGRSGVGGLAQAAAIDGSGIDPVALGVQVAICGAGGGALVVLSGLAGRRGQE